MRDQTAIAGIGYAEFSRDSGVSTLTLGLRAVTAALEDAGLPVSEVDTGGRVGRAEAALHLERRAGHRPGHRAFPDSVERDLEARRGQDRPCLRMPSGVEHVFLEREAGTLLR